MSGQCSVLIAMVRTPLDEFGSGLAVFGIIAIGRLFIQAIRGDESMGNLRRVTAGLALLVGTVIVTPVCLAKGSPTQSAIEHAKAAAASGHPDPARDFLPLLDALATATKREDQDDLINALRDIGSYDSPHSTAAVKNYLREAAPPVLLKFAQGHAESQRRSMALSLLRKFNVSDAVLDQAIAVCEADTSTDPGDRKVMASRVEVMRSWKHRVGGLASDYFTLAPADPETERRALAFLSAGQRGISVDDLASAASHGEATVVEALLDAGMPVNTQVGMSANALGNAAGEGCVESEVDTAALIKTIDVLVRRGIDVNPNQGNNGFLFDAARYCPVVIVQKLIDIGVKVERNPGGFSPLQVALASGKWDVATLLVDHGARLSKKEVDEIFFEKPTDPKQLALLKRAAGK
jgi:hypothetical protein